MTNALVDIGPNSRLLDLDGKETALRADKLVGEPSAEYLEIESKFLKTRGITKPLAEYHFPEYVPGDSLLWYHDIGILAGTAGYVLVRNKRMVAYRVCMRG